MKPLLLFVLYQTTFSVFIRRRLLADYSIEFNYYEKSMVQGLAFLSKKGFNPQNQSNRKQVWEAQHTSKQEQERIKQRREQLRRERDEEELARARHGETGGSQAQLRFMYDVPPGMKTDKNNPQQELQQQDESKNTTNMDSTVTQIQPGDDAAAAAFRRMLAAQSAGIDLNHEDDSKPMNEQDKDDMKLRFGPVLQGTNLEKTTKPKAAILEGLSALEKAVGRRDGAGGALSLEEQIARFPQLKNAPMAKGMNATDVNVSFKPLGAQLRNVKCLACGIWGHSRGDRECAKSGWDPFSSFSNRPGPSSTLPDNSMDRIPRDLNLQKEGKNDHKKRKQESGTGSRDGDDDDDDDNDSSSSSDESDDSRERRKHKTKRRESSSSRRKRHKKNHSRHVSSLSDQRKRRDRSESSDRKRSRKSYKKKRSSRKEDR